MKTLEKLKLSSENIGLEGGLIYKILLPVTAIVVSMMVPAMILASSLIWAEIKDVDKESVKKDVFINRVVEVDRRIEFNRNNMKKFVDKQEELLKYIQNMSGKFEGLTTQTDLLTEQLRSQNQFFNDYILNLTPDRSKIKRSMRNE